MKALKSARTLAASLGVLAAGALAATPAQAFDSVDWSWKNTLTQTEDVYVDIDIDLDSTGIVEVEKLQIFLGNAYAKSSVTNIDNDPDYGGEWLVKYVYCYPVYYFDKGTLDAIYELPEVNSDAVAIGNLQSITTDTPVFLHDAQIVANTDGYNSPYCTHFDELLAYAGSKPYSNLHTDLALAFTYGAVFGVLDKADIKAESYVAYISDASVDSTATAIANITTVTLESNVDGTYPVSYDHYDPNALLSNHIVKADFTQFAYANVSATSNVHDVEVDSYTNLRKITNADGDVVPLVNSVATAIGNAVTINVGPVPTP